MSPFASIYEVGQADGAIYRPGPTSYMLRMAKTLSFWALDRTFAAYDSDGELVAVLVYKKGAREIVRRITE